MFRVFAKLDWWQMNDPSLNHIKQHLDQQLRTTQSFDGQKQNPITFKNLGI